VRATVRSNQQLFWIGLSFAETRLVSLIRRTDGLASVDYD